MGRWRDQLHGGKADRLTPAMFPKQLLIEGMRHELEHTKSHRLAMEIAMDHLAEDLDYYQKLKHVEGNPSTSHRQQRFMCAELGRKRRGQRTRTGMSVRQLKEFCMARKKNPVTKTRMQVTPPLSAQDMKSLRTYVRGLKKARPTYFDRDFSFEYRGSTVTFTRKRAKNPHLTSGKWRFVGMFRKGEIGSVKRILKIHGMKYKVTKDQLKGERGQRELYVERGAFDTAYRAISRLFEAGKAA